MLKKLPGNRFRLVLPVLGLAVLAAVAMNFTGSVSSTAQDTGTMEKMVVSAGTVSIDLDRSLLTGSRKNSTAALRLNAAPDNFFTVIAYNDELRGSIPGTMALTAQDTYSLPGRLGSAYQNLVFEALPMGSGHEFAVRDANTGFTFFNLQGHMFAYDPANRAFTIKGGKLLLTDEFAADLGRPAAAGTVVGSISIETTLRPIEVTTFLNGEVESAGVPAGPDAGTVPGPDVIVGDLFDLGQVTGDGTTVGLAVGTTSCNKGIIPLNWFQNGNNDHPVIPQNLYRMSGGPNNNDRFEQIGQSWVKHAFTALQQNFCGFGCNSSGTGTLLGSGCSDPYSAGLNAGPNLGSRAFINPFTGFFPTGTTTNNNHGGHSHTGAAHNIRTPIADLNTTQNAGATYYAEAQYITPHEYAHCQANPTQCNMYNNVSYRRYNVSGTTSFSFSPVGSTVREAPAISAWPGATIVEVKPAPGVDGVAYVAYKVTQPTTGVWRYEFAIYNQNLDRAISSFGIPLGNGVTITNTDFNMPPQHPGWVNDGTVGNTGFSSTPWTQTNLTGSISWGTESFALNQNANAVRWGTLYNIGFDSNRGPVPGLATIGFFKTGEPITIPVQIPTPSATQGCSRSQFLNRLCE